MIDVNFVHEGRYRTHNMKVMYNFNGVELDDNVSIVHLNSTTINPFISSKTIIKIFIMGQIQDSESKYSGKTYNSNDAKYLIILKENGTYTEEDIMGQTNFRCYST